MSEPPNEEDRPVTNLWRNGVLVASYTDPPPPPPPIGSFRLRKNDLSKLLSAKLKVERAKRHIGELEAEIQSFLSTNPDPLIGNIDAKTGDNVVTVDIQKEVPVHWSAIVGDIVHNLRSSLDCLVCDLVRTHTHQDTLSGGFPITKRGRREKAARMGEIDRVSVKAKRLVQRFYKCDRWHDPMWALHWLDLIDKHNRIVPVASAVVQVTSMAAVTGIFQSPEGNILLGGPGPGGRPFFMPGGVPDRFRRVCPLNRDTELHRVPDGFTEYVSATFTISIAEAGVWEGEPVVETLKQVADLVERTVQTFDRVA